MRRAMAKPKPPKSKVEKVHEFMQLVLADLERFTPHVACHKGDHEDYPSKIELITARPLNQQHSRYGKIVGNLFPVALSIGTEAGQKKTPSLEEQFNLYLSTSAEDHRFLCDVLHVPVFCTIKNTTEASAKSSKKIGKLKRARSSPSVKTDKTHEIEIPVALRLELEVDERAHMTSRVKKIHISIAQCHEEQQDKIYTAIREVLSEFLPINKNAKAIHPTKFIKQYSYIQNFSILLANSKAAGFEDNNPDERDTLNLLKEVTSDNATRRFQTTVPLHVSPKVPARKIKVNMPTIDVTSSNEEIKSLELGSELSWLQRKIQTARSYLSLIIPKIGVNSWLRRRAVNAASLGIKLFEFAWTILTQISIITYPAPKISKANANLRARRSVPVYTNKEDGETKLIEIMGRKIFRSRLRKFAAVIGAVASPLIYFYNPNSHYKTILDIFSGLTGKFNFLVFIEFGVLVLAGAAIAIAIAKICMQIFSYFRTGYTNPEKYQVTQLDLDALATEYPRSGMKDTQFTNKILALAERERNKHTILGMRDWLFGNLYDRNKSVPALLKLFDESHVRQVGKILEDTRDELLASIEEYRALIHETIETSQTEIVLDYFDNARRELVQSAGYRSARETFNHDAVMTQIESKATDLALLENFDLSIFNSTLPLARLHTEETLMREDFFIGGDRTPLTPS